MSTYDYLIQAGEKKGEKKEKILATKGLLKEGMSNEFICRVLRTTDEFVDKLRDEMDASD